MIFSQRNPLISRGHRVTEVAVVALRFILKGIVNGIASEEGVLVGNCLVETHLPVILSERVMVVESLDGGGATIRRVPYRPWVGQRYERQQRSSVGTKRRLGDRIARGVGVN